MSDPATHVLEPVCRPPAVAILDRIRSRVAQLGDDPPPVLQAILLETLAVEVENLAPYITPIPLQNLSQELAAITTGLMTSTMSTALRCEAVGRVHHQVDRLIALNLRLHGREPDESPHPDFPPPLVAEASTDVSTT